MSRAPGEPPAAGRLSRLRRRGWRLLAALAVIAAPAAAQGDEAQRKVAEATQLFERAERRNEVGDQRGRIRLYREAIVLVDEAIALGSTDPRVVFGRREVGLELGDMLLAAERPGEALAAFGEVAAIAGAGAAAPGESGAEPIPADRQDRLHLARALRGMVQAALAMEDFGEARARLGRLLAVGRAMHAAEPDNLYLTRRLAQDLENEAFFRWVTEDAAGTRETALEALALFRAVDETNPGSDEAMRNHFRWAYIAAVLHDGDQALWDEALALGERLESRRELRGPDEDYLRVVRLRARE